AHCSAAAPPGVSQMTDHEPWVERTVPCWATAGPDRARPLMTSAPVRAAIGAIRRSVMGLILLDSGVTNHANLARTERWRRRVAHGRPGPRIRCELSEIKARCRDFCLAGKNAAQSFLRIPCGP